MGAPIGTAVAGSVRGRWRWTKRRSGRDPLAATAVLCAAALVVVLASSRWTADPVRQDLANRFAAPSRAHPFGTDQLGRDLLARTSHGGRRWLAAAGAIVALTFPFGLAVGVTAGLVGRRLRQVVMRIVDVFLAVPSFVVAIAVAGTLGPGLANLVIAVSLTAWSPYARLAAISVVEIERSAYVNAARAAGASRFHVARRHLLPAVLPSLSVVAMLQVGETLLLVAGLSFLGLGVQPPRAEWGSMIREAQQFVDSAPQLFIGPGLGVVCSVVCCSALADLLQARFGLEAKAGFARRPRRVIRAHRAADHA